LKKSISILGCFFAFLILSPTLLRGQCTVSTVGVNFGSYEPLSSMDSSSTGTITIYCDADSAVTVLIGPSPNSGGFNPRKMMNASGPDRLSYNLYTTISMSAIWGDGTGGASTVQRQVLKRTNTDLIVYGRVPASQDVAVGQYGESLVVTINF
jgi:spore coat protein U-like protein